MQYWRTPTAAEARLSIKQCVAAGRTQYLDVRSGRVNRLRSPAGLPLAAHAASTGQQTTGRRRYAPRVAPRTEGGKKSECFTCHESSKSQARNIS
jgi:hypothetical protein